MPGGEKYQQIGREIEAMVLEEGVVTREEIHFRLCKRFTTSAIDRGIRYALDAGLIVQEPQLFGKYNRYVSPPKPWHGLDKAVRNWRRA